MKYFYGAGGGGAGFVSIVAFGFSVGLETPAFPPCWPVDKSTPGGAVPVPESRFGFVVFFPCGESACFSAVPGMYPGVGLTSSDLLS